MRVQFEATLDDLVDVHVRALARSRVARGWRWEGSLLCGLLAGIGLFLSLSVLGDLIEWPFEAKLALSIVGAIAGAVVYPFSYRRTIAHRLRKYCREQIGAELPFTVEVELHLEGVRVKQLGADITFEWASVEDIQEREDSVDIVTRHGGMVAVRRRAFDSFGAMEEFVDLARRYLDQSQAGAKS